MKPDFQGKGGKKDELNPRKKGQKMKAGSAERGFLSVSLEGGNSQGQRNAEEKTLRKESLAAILMINSDRKNNGELTWRVFEMKPNFLGKGGKKGELNPGQKKRAGSAERRYSSPSLEGGSSKGEKKGSPDFAEMTNFVKDKVDKFEMKAVNGDLKGSNVLM